MARTGLLLTAVLLLGGCDDGAGGRGFGPGGQSGGKADDAEGEGEEGDDEARIAFLDAVTRCEALADRGRETIGAARIEQRVAVEEERLECVRAATDATLDSIEAKLEGAESSLVGESEASFTAWREANVEFCDLLVAASESAVDKDAAVHEARCVAKAEVLLAEAIATYADLGGAPADAPEAREAYSACYEAFDAALEEEPDMSEAEAGGEEEVAPELEATVAAHAELADCIRTTTADLDDELAARVAESFPGRAVDNLQEDIAGDFASTAEAADAVCNVLGAASADAGEPEAELQAGSCIVSTSIWRGRLLGDVVPALAPTQPEEPTEDPPADEPTDPTA